MVYQRHAKPLSVTQPPGFADAFKALAKQYTENRNVRGRVTTSQDLHEEAVRILLDRIKRDKKVVFVATPHHRKKRTTMWFESSLIEEIRAVAEHRNVSMATVVLTACLAYLEAHDIELH